MPLATLQGFALSPDEPDGESGSDGSPPDPPMSERSERDWRRGRDSNPRTPFEVNGFQDRRLKPLGHLSGEGSIMTQGQA